MGKIIHPIYEWKGIKSLSPRSPWGHEESDTTEQLHFDFHAPLLVLHSILPGVGLDPSVLRSPVQFLSVQRTLPRFSQFPQNLGSEILD